MTWEPLRGRSALITGAGRGLGAALAICLADQGCEVMLAGRQKEDLLRVADAIHARTGQAAGTCLLDLVRPEDIATAVDELHAACRRLDILINNGAAWLPAQHAPYTPEQVSGVVNSAITGTFLLTQALIPLLMKSKAAQVLTIGSTCALPGAEVGPLSAPFYAAKQGQRAIIDGMRDAARGSGVRFQTLHPADLKDVSPLDAGWDQPAPEGRLTNRDVVEAVLFVLTRRFSMSVRSIELTGSA